MFALIIVVVCDGVCKFVVGCFLVIFLGVVSLSVYGMW